MACSLCSCKLLHVMIQNSKCGNYGGWDLIKEPTNKMKQYSNSIHYFPSWYSAILCLPCILLSTESVNFLSVATRVQSLEPFGHTYVNDLYHAHHCWEAEVRDSYFHEGNFLYSEEKLTVATQGSIFFFISGTKWHWIQLVRHGVFLCMYITLSWYIFAFCIVAVIVAAVLFLTSLLFPVNCSYLNLASLPFFPLTRGGHRREQFLIFSVLSEHQYCS